MKTKLSLVIGFLLFLAVNSANSQDVASKNTDLQSGSVTVMCTPDLQQLTSKLVSEYISHYPEVKISIINASYSSTELGTGENLSFISNKAASAFSDTQLWRLAIGKNVIVPVINSGNPYLTDLRKQGLTQTKFIQLFQNLAQTNWGKLLSNKGSEKVQIYIVNDEDLKSGLAKWLKNDQLQFVGVTVGTRDEVISAIQRDPFAIGFCNAVDIQNLESNSLIANISLIPIDRNGNGNIDYMEDIYTDMNTFYRGVWIGKYPKTLVNNIYAVSRVQPVNENELSFLKWVLTDGQQLMVTNGFSDLVGNESQLQLDKMNIVNVNLAETKSANSLAKILMGILTILVMGIILGSVVRSRNRKRLTTQEIINHTDVLGFNANSVNAPNGLYFDKTHTWAFMEKDGLVSIGMDDFLQHVTGTITRIEMKSAGEIVKKGELLFSISQSGKQLNMYAPVSGVIKAQNNDLLNDTSPLNTSPYTDGWVCRIEPTNWFKEIQLLDMSDKYRRWLNAEFLRLKDFMAAILRAESPEYAHILLQDGGELKDGMLVDFGPEVWEDFQTNFLDTFK